MVFTGTVSNNLSLPQWSFLTHPTPTTPAPSLPSAAPPTRSSTPRPRRRPSTRRLPPESRRARSRWMSRPPPRRNLHSRQPATRSVSSSPLPRSPSASRPPRPTSPSAATQQFIGYAVGNVNNTLIWQVNGVTGGSTVHHRDHQLQPALYVAPATMPMSGNTVTITIISQADPTKTASVVITLQ